MTPFLSLLLFYAFHANGKEISCKWNQLKVSDDLMAISCEWVTFVDLWESYTSKTPVLLKVENKINPLPWSTFYYDAQNIQQIPWGTKTSPTDEIVYFLFSGLAGHDVIVAKIKLLQQKESIQQIDIEGIYKAAGMYEAGGVIWKKMDKLNDWIKKEGSNHGVQYESETKAKLIMKKNDKNNTPFKILNEYKDNLFALKKAQENGKMWKVEINKNEHHYFHPLKFRGVYRWRVSKVIIKSGFAEIDFLPPRYNPMKMDTSNQYEFMYLGKKYILKMGVEKTYGLVVTISNDKGEKVDGAVIFWEQQYAGHCSRHTLNNIYNKEEYPKCKEYLEEVDKLPFKSEKLIKREEDFVTDTERTLIKLDSRVIPEMLHTKYNTIVIDTIDTKLDTMLLQNVVQQYQHWSLYEADNGPQKVLNKKKEFKDWYETLLKSKEIKGIIKASESHVYFLRKTHSQNKHGATADKKKEKINNKKEKINNKKDVEPATLNYWLNVDSALTNGPTYISPKTLEQIDDDSLIYIVLETSYDKGVLFPARLWSKERVQKNLVTKANLGINNIHDYGEYVGDGNDIIIDDNMNVMLIMDIVVWMILLLGWMCLCCLGGLFGMYLVNKKISNKYNIDENDDNGIHV